MVERGPPRAHELRRGVPQHAVAPGVPGTRRGLARGGEPDREQEQRIPDLAYFRTDPDPVSRPGFLLVHGQEFHTSYWGHAALLGLTDHYLLPEYAGFPNTAAASLYPTNAAVADLAHARARSSDTCTRSTRRPIRPTQRSRSPTSFRWTSRSARWTT